MKKVPFALLYFEEKKLNGKVPPSTTCFSNIKVLPWSLTDLIA
jgi:hypothetical protein